MTAKHKVTIHRVVHEDDSCNDYAICSQCAYVRSWENVDPASPLPRKADLPDNCGDRIVRAVMES